MWKTPLLLKCHFSRKWENINLTKMCKSQKCKMQNCVKILRLTPPMSFSALKPGPVVPPGIEKTPDQAARISQSVDFGHLSDILAILRGGRFLTLFSHFFTFWFYHFLHFLIFWFCHFFTFSVFLDFVDFVTFYVFMIFDDFCQFLIIFCHFFWWHVWYLFLSLFPVPQRTRGTSLFRGQIHTFLYSYFEVLFLSSHIKKWPFFYIFGLRIETGTLFAGGYRGQNLSFFVILGCF